MVELKPRSLSNGGKFAGKIRHNQEALFDDEYKQLVAVAKTEDKEEQLLFIFNLLKITPSSDRVIATPEEAKVKAYIKKLDEYIASYEAQTKTLVNADFVHNILNKCEDKLLKSALEQHYFKVAEVPKVAEFTF